MTRMNYGPHYRGMGIRGGGGWWGSQPSALGYVTVPPKVLKALMRQIESRRDISRDELERVGLSLCGVRGELRGVDLTGVSAQSTDFTLSDLTEACLRNIDGTAAVFGNCRLVRTDFDGATLTGTSFRGADLTRACLRNCDLEDADFTGATLARADLTGSVLSPNAWRRARAKGALRRPDGGIEPW